MFTIYYKNKRGQFISNGEHYITQNMNIENVGDIMSQVDWDIEYLKVE